MEVWERFGLLHSCEDTRKLKKTSRSEDPSRIYNADEMGFALDSKSGSVLGPAKSEDFYGKKSNAEKEQITACDILCNGIIHIALFPNARHTLQPADMLIPKPLKMAEPEINF
ncbi:hypothetical protein ILUMI_22172 [Ignelater luminosus]|uniref:Uncharacterized protein n=1 Tax=Ignelater luminosus TaxID=2038154 RepID=A0A8K0CGA9_IGNLU|nr:hypothetical protein ILUMI_22172 [Ignelater luminosus]